MRVLLGLVILAVIIAGCLSPVQKIGCCVEENKEDGCILYNTTTFTTQDYTAQTTVGITFNLNEYIKGLSADLSLGFDAFNNIYLGKNLAYATYRIVTEDSLVRIGEDEVKSTESRFYDDFSRNAAGYASINYIRNFGKHDISANLVYSVRQLAYKSTEDWETGVKQDYTGVNLGFRGNYAFNDKYVLRTEGSLLAKPPFSLTLHDRERNSIKGYVLYITAGFFLRLK